MCYRVDQIIYNRYAKFVTPQYFKLYNQLIDDKTVLELAMWILLDEYFDLFWYPDQSSLLHNDILQL